MRIGFAAYRHLLHHLQSVTFESDYLLRVIGQEAKLTNAEIEKDLRAESIISQITWIPKFGICFYRVESFLLQFVSVNFCCEPNAASLLAHINQDTAAFFLNLPKRRVQLVSTVAPARTEYVAGEALAVYAHQGRFAVIDFTLNQGQMMLSVEFRAI